MPRALVIEAETTSVRITVNKGETLRITFPVYDSSTPPALQNATGFTAAAIVKPYGLDTILASWSTTAGTITCDSSGVTLLLNGATTAAWTWDQGRFELDISASGTPSRLAEGPFVARPQLVIAP